MENAESDTSSNEPEVVQVFGIDTRDRVNLQCIVIQRRIFK